MPKTIALFTLFLIAAPAFAATTFTPVDDNTGPYQSVLHTMINNNGAVAVEWLKDDGNTSINLYGPDTRTVAFGGPQAQTSFFNVGFPSLNNNGQVAFWGAAYGPTLTQAVYRDTAGVKTAVVPLGINDAFGNYTGINDAGIIAFRATISSVTAVRRSDGVIIAQAGSNGFTSFLDPSINNSGDVAFKAQRSGLTGIYRGNGGAITTIADSSGPISDFFTAAPSMNTAGKLVFSASLDAGGEALYLADGATLTPILDTTGIFSDFSWSSINNLNQVAFTATLDAGGGGIYFYNGTPGSAEKVIAIGDSLFGGTVQSVFLNNHNLNDSAQLSFTYILTNGTRGVGIATIPEPACVLLSFVPAACALLRRRESRPSNDSCRGLN